MLLLIGLMMAALACCHGAEGPLVHTSLGQLRGQILKSRAGRDYAAFTHVPFGKPPVGSRRFKDPEPADPWTGILDATKRTPICYQPEGQKPSGEEDCLYLNIYTPNVNASLPVMIYLYGGGWIVGQPGPPKTAKYFMDEDVVLVMPNYRLGPFGFISTEDKEIPGNMGLKDMALAIEWTEQNIKNFGGDPKSMTLFGLSAGGASTHLLCSALRTRLLLKGCISESGVGGAFWTLPKPGWARSNAYKVANSLGCFGDELLKCLQSKPAEDILKSDHVLRFWTGEPLIIYSPVIERKGEEALITEWPTDSNFPWMTGITSGEGLLKVALVDLFYKNESYKDDFYTNKEEYLIRMLNLNESRRDLAMKVYNRCFQNATFYEGIEKLFSEALFVNPVLKQLKAHSGPKYFYVFNYTQGHSFWELMNCQRLNLPTSRVIHGDNYHYFFDLSMLPCFKELSPKSSELSKDLIKLWVNFAKHQNPSPEGKPEWKQFGDKNSYLYIGDSGFSMKEYQNAQEILEFWKQIYT